jgi:uncharacterized membrane protein YdjX (TVP38/TMEM64 family)
MSWLSEHWLRFAEKINGIIFSFVFFWGTIGFIYHAENKLYNYLERLHNASGNGGYFALQIVLVLVSTVVDFIWAIMPFITASGIIYWNKVDD